MRWPKLRAVPDLHLRFGIGSLSKVALVFLECLYPIVIITSQGARGVGRVCCGRRRTWALRAREICGASSPCHRAVHLRRVPRRPAGGDDRVVITEMISSADGLGYQVIYALSSLKTDRMLAIVVVIALLAAARPGARGAARRLVYWEKLETYYVRRDAS